MKKLVLFFATVVAVSFASCSKESASEEEAAPATEEVATEPAVEIGRAHV